LVCLSSNIFSPQTLVKEILYRGFPYDLVDLAAAQADVSLFVQTYGGAESGGESVRLGARHKKCSQSAQDVALYKLNLPLDIPPICHIFRGREFFVYPGAKGSKLIYTYGQ
jgi:hypothetical protein